MGGGHRGGCPVRLRSAGPGSRACALAVGGGGAGSRRSPSRSGDRREAEVVRPAGWVWQGTGQNFGEWWGQQDTASRNRWLQSREVWLGFDKYGYQFMPVDLEAWLVGMRAGGTAAVVRKMFKAMKDSGIAGVKLSPEQMVVHTTDGRRLAVRR